MSPRPRQKLTAKRIIGCQKLRLMSFFVQGKLADVTIKTEDNKEFQAHRVILASHSQFFETMFTTDMQEAKTGVVHIKDASSEIIGIILRFMYSGVVEKLPLLFSEIFAAAHLYDVQELLQVIVNYMSSNICPENATKILRMSIQYSLENTELTVRTFIDNNEQLMIKRDEYLAHLMEIVSVDNVVESLKLVKKYELADLKHTLMKFIADNFKQVLELQKYRKLYADSQWVGLIIEIDRYISGVMEQRSDCISNAVEMDNNMSDLVDEKCNIK